MDYVLKFLLKRITVGSTNKIITVMHIMAFTLLMQKYIFNLVHRS